MNVLVLMAGAAPDFAERGIVSPRYLIEIQNKPIVQRTLEALEKFGSSITCVIRKEEQDRYFMGDALKVMAPGLKVICVPGDTRGAVCTALFAIDDINNGEELLILNGDQLIKADIARAIEDFRSRELDGGLVVFQAISPKYSSVLLDENKLVIQTSEKRPISPLASTGCCYYRRGSDFVRAAFAVLEKDVNTQGSYYVSSTFNEMILEQARIGVFEIARKDYVSFGSYQMYESYMAHRRG